MIYLKWLVLIYLALGVLTYVIGAYYVHAMRDRDAQCANMYYKFVAIRQLRWRFAVTVGIFFYVMILWLPIILGARIPPMPPLDGSK